MIRRKQANAQTVNQGLPLGSLPSIQEEDVEMAEDDHKILEKNAPKI